MRHPPGVTEGPGWGSETVPATLGAVQKAIPTSRRHNDRYFVIARRTFVLLLRFAVRTRARVARVHRVACGTQSARNRVEHSRFDVRFLAAFSARLVGGVFVFAFFFSQIGRLRRRLRTRTTMRYPTAAPTAGPIASIIATPKRRCCTATLTITTTSAPKPSLRLEKGN